MKGAYKKMFGTPTYKSIVKEYPNCLIIANVIKRKRNGRAWGYQVLRTMKEWNVVDDAIKTLKEQGFKDIMVIDNTYPSEHNLNKQPPELVAMSMRAYLGTN